MNDFCTPRYHSWCQAFFCWECWYFLLDIKMVSGGTQNLMGWFQTPRKWTDLEQYVNPHTTFFIQLQELAKLQWFQNRNFAFTLPPSVLKVSTTSNHQSTQCQSLKYEIEVGDNQLMWWVFIMTQSQGSWCSGDLHVFRLQGLTSIYTVGYIYVFAPQANFFQID